IYNATRLYIPGDSLSERITLDMLSVEDFIGGPTEFGLSQNYPNPFNPTTSIAFKLDKAEKISMKVYDITGQLVKTVIDNKNYNAGSHVVTIDMSKHSTGVYFTVLNNGSQELIRKMMLLK
ncbi:MAG: T9SS type A sorting domain-containing protein, partial [Calditrichaceae bacterium]